MARDRRRDVRAGRVQRLARIGPDRKRRHDGRGRAARYTELMAQLPPFDEPASPDVTAYRIASIRARTTRCARTSGGATRAEFLRERRRARTCWNRSRRRARLAARSAAEAHRLSVETASREVARTTRIDVHERSGTAELRLPGSSPTASVLRAETESADVTRSRPAAVLIRRQTWPPAAPYASAHARAQQRRTRGRAAPGASAAT